MSSSLEQRRTHWPKVVVWMRARAMQETRGLGIATALEGVYAVKEKQKLILALTEGADAIEEWLEAHHG